jgi:hypothetical protein
MIKTGDLVQFDSENSTLIVKHIFTKLYKWKFYRICICEYLKSKQVLFANIKDLFKIN